MSDPKVITSDIGMPVLSEEQCFHALSFDYMMDVSKQTISNQEGNESDDARKMVMAATTVIQKLEEIKKQYDSTMTRLSDSEKFAYGVEDDDLDFVVQKQLGFITNESTPTKKKLTPSGYKRAYIFFYSNSENRKSFAENIKQQVKDKRRFEAEEKAFQKRIEKRRAKKKAAKKANQKKR